MNGLRKRCSRYLTDRARIWVLTGADYRPEIHHRLVKALDPFCRRDLFADLP
jgi:hypothetical protein